MSYTPTNWQTGDTVTAEKLNKMEQGIELANDPFVVTLTPTAQDFSGVMDKTVEEIDAAYRAGKQIVFFVMDSNGGFEVPLSSAGFSSGFTYPSFNAELFYTKLDVLVSMFTVTSNDGTKNTYSTTVYTLTPAS